jgi:hypothetical protein
MPSVKNKLAFEDLRKVLLSAFTGVYQTFGVPMAHPIRIFKITNNTTVGVTVSYDGGTKDHEYIPAGSFLLIDVTSDRVWDCEFALAEGVQVSFKSDSAPGVGTTGLYLSTYYAV